MNKNVSNAKGKGSGAESKRVAAAEAAGGPWWTGPTWVRVTPGFKGGSVRDVGIYAKAEAGK